MESANAAMSQVSIKEQGKGGEKEKEREREKGEPVTIRKEEPPCSVDNSGPTLEGNRWYIRKAINSPEPVIIKPEAINQALAIEDSKKVAIKVEGKINAVLGGTNTTIVSNLMF